MEIAQLPRHELVRSSVEMPNERSVARVEKWHSEILPFASRIENTARVAFRLLENVLRVHGDFLCFDDSKAFATDEKGVVSRAVSGRKFFDGALVEFLEIKAGAEWHNLPTLSL